MIPPVAFATVISQDPDNYGVIVAVHGLTGGQAPALAVKVATHGPRDAVRGHFPELPQVGNHGLVAFPRKDGRNGVWLGTFEPGQNDASPYAPGTTGTHYHALYAGGWSWEGPDGTAAKVLADGSYLLAGGALPAPTRHTVDGTQTRRRTAFTAAERNPAPPSPLPLLLNHASGAQAGVTAAGAVTASAASGQTATLSANGASLAIGAAGQVTVTAASGEPLTLSCGGATITFDGSGNVTIADAGGAMVKLVGALATVTKGGTPQFVRLTTGGPSSVLMADQ